jgi:ParB-like chromosome segregation protein Spo0J
MEPNGDSVRLAILNRLEESARKKIERTHSVYFQSDNHNLPVFKVDINFPRFRMENGRTKRKQLEFIHKHKDREAELTDPSSDSAQAIQYTILKDMATEADLLELLKQGQHEPLLLGNDGYVVNGNRRLAAMRLLHSDPEKYKSKVDFSHIDVARLPVLEEKEIRRIEQRLQMSKDGKADYNWVDELLTIQANIADYRMSIAELAKDMNKRKPTIENQLRMLSLIDMYLERSGKEGQYFLVESDEQAFKTLAQGYAKYAGDTQKQLQLLDLAFPIIFSNEAGASKHVRIGMIVENLPAVAAIALANEDLNTQDSNAAAADDILETPQSVQPGKPAGLNLDVSSSEKVHDAIRDIIRERDLQDQANGPAEAVAQAATLLKNIKISPTMTKIKQFRSQIESIRSTCDELVEELENGNFEIDQ